MRETSLTGAIHRPHPPCADGEDDGGLAAVSSPSPSPSRRAGWGLLLAISLLPGSMIADEKPPAISAPRSIEESLKLFRLSDQRLRIEPVAAEPEVMDPVAAQFDEDGRLWVVEMGDYPHGPADGETPKSRIKILEDRDGDGRYETAAVFADKLLFVTELQPWKGGVIVTLAGEVVYLRDTDNDGKADQRETWYRGFAQENSQLRANHPRLGLDGWIYVSNGLRGGAVSNVRIPDAPAIPLAGKDFRFHPTTFACEAITGVGQFGLTFDDYGNRFICSNRNPLMHVVLEERYLQRNPKYAPPAARHDVAKAAEESRIYALSRAWTTSNLHAGQFTAACGCLIFRGSGLPADFYGNGFTCDPTANLVHCEVLKPAGATFASEPVSKEVEFLASPDEWFRPVNLFNGPDGALYIVDMYRAVIEHPDFMPNELKKRADLLLGVDRGRIWRVCSKELQRPKPAKLSTETGSQLVGRLNTPGHIGDAAFRLIYERQDKSVAGELERLAEQGSGVGTIRALWLLEHLNSLKDKTLIAALQAKDPRVREQAVRLAEPRFATEPEWRNRLVGVVGVARDDDPRVRFQVAMSLAPVSHPRELNVGLMPIAYAGADDVWTRRGVAIAVGDRAGELAGSFLQAAGVDSQLTVGQAALVAELFTVAAAQRNPTQLAELLGVICRSTNPRPTPRMHRELLLNFAEATRSNGIGLTSLLKDLSDDDRKRFKELMNQAKVTLREDPDINERVAAVQLLGYDDESASEMINLARFSASASGTPAEVRLRALAAVARRPAFDQWPDFLSDWQRESPAFRRGMVEALLGRPETTQLFLDAIESGQVKPAELDTATSNRLLKHRQRPIRTRAEKLLASLIPADRQKVLDEYQPVLKLKPDRFEAKKSSARTVRPAIGSETWGSTWRLTFLILA